jgi:hypothetical protein
MNLIFSDKYSKVYRDGSHLKGSFTISCFVQVISLLFIQLPKFFVWLKDGLDTLHSDYYCFNFFVLSKYLIEKIIATAFN